ncbi:MAG: cation-translocating P-type ATPase [Alphaproteobacteria bacterium]|nr:cation-translocating P-type ATPase [Alphaproteobacteria bacterium]
MHAQPADEVLAALTTTPSGLTDAEAERRRAELGANELPHAAPSFWRRLVRQFQDVLVLVLVAALALAVATPFLEGGPIAPASFLDAAVIGAILVLNTVLGLVQEGRAERAIQALQALSAPRVRVRRDGLDRVLPSAELVPGDVVVLEAGDRVAADARVLQEAHLEVDESTLTGESLPTDKTAEPVAADAVVAEQRSMVFSGTLVTRGSGLVVVTATGLHTQTGRIARLVTEAVLPETPLQAQLRRLGRTLGLVALGIVAAVVAVGVARAMPLLEVLLVGLALAVSAVPEGLPAVVTVSFALGVRQMARQQALVRRLDALETLGAVTTIATDKTGTLTANRMEVVDAWVAPGATRRELALAMASCNHACLPELGDPTELALLAWAAGLDVERLAIAEEEIPFTSEERYMRTRHEGLAFVKGAPERLADLVAATDLGPFLAEADARARRGERVLAAAVDHGDGLALLGLVGMEDPPREGVADALAEARAAGIRTVMVTGDHVVTAQAIARRVGLPDAAMEGRALDGLSPEALQEAVARVSVFARVSPHHKVVLCQALQARGEVVAMTGDGVNDAPALKAAHVGVAMGGRGTEVAREAAAIVLADDHYRTIVRAVREGRRIHDNIRRFVLYLLRANFDELLLVLTALAVGWPLPFLPIHVLWINLLTDGLPALALATEPAAPDVMSRPPRPASQGLLTGEGGRLVASVAVCYLATLAFFAWQVQVAPSEDAARTATLTLAIGLELLLAFSARTDGPAWRRDPRTNPWLLRAVGIVVGAHALLLLTPLGTAFHLEAIPASTWPVLLGVAGAAFLALEGVKAFHRTVVRA